MNPDLPEEVFLAVNPRGILIINPDSKVRLALVLGHSFRVTHERPNRIVQALFIS